MKLSKYILFGLLLILTSANTFAQKDLSYYLQMSGQTRYDSLTLRGLQHWDMMDTLKLIKEFQIIRDYAKKHNDPILGFYAEYFDYLFSGTDKRSIKSKKRQENFLNLYNRVKKLPSNSQTERLWADIEHESAKALTTTKSSDPKVLRFFLQADLRYRKIGYKNVFLAGFKLAHLGHYYYDIIADYDVALKYLKEAEHYILNDPIDFHRIYLYRAIATCLVEKKRYAEAIQYNELGIKQVLSKKDSVRVGGMTGNIGEIILNHTNHPFDAETYFRKELVLRLKYKPKGTEDIAKVYGNLCQVAGLKRQADSVKIYYEKALEMALIKKKSSDIHYILRSLYFNRMVADSLLGDYKSAFQFRNLYNQEDKIINNQDLKLATTQASVQFESEKFKLQADLSEEQAQNSRFWIIIISLLLLLALLSAIGLYNFQKTRREKLAHQLEIESNETKRLTELDSLKTRFFTNISHEFRTPLTLILSPLQDLQKEYPQKGTFKIMQQNAERLLSLINQLLDLSKLEARQMEVTPTEGDLAQIIQLILVSFESLAQNRNILFRYQQSHTIWTTRFDADKVEKVVVNLLSNAFKFTPENGRVQVKANYSQNRLNLEIQDSGIGIPPENLPYIFDRFYQVNDELQRNYEGTGVGLALVKELLNIMNGRITVESEVGRGTKFTVTLPCEPVEIKRSFQVKAMAKEIPNHSIINQKNEQKVIDEGNKGVLLIVEDNTDMRAYISSIFKENYQIIEAFDGQDGIEKTIQNVPDLVICDLMMPRLNGLEFCKLIKNNEITSHIPIVMLTAKAALNDRIEGLELGADDYLAKPFNSQELQIRVRNLIQNRELLQQKHQQNVVILSQNITPSEPSIEDKFLTKVNANIEQHIADSSFNIENLGELLNMSSVQLRRKLKALTNQTAVEYLRNYRLEKAATMLKNKEGNVSEIAFSVGFESVPYFSKTFQERFGVKPSDW